MLCLAWGLVLSCGDNMGVLWGEHESKASLRSELGRGSKRTLWHRRLQWAARCPSKIRESF